MLATLWVDNGRCTFGDFGPKHFMLISWRKKLQKLITSIYKQVWATLNMRMTLEGFVLYC